MSFIKTVSKNFWTENYRELMSDLLKRFKTMECYMSVNIHFLDSHLNYFPENLGTFSDEHAVHCYQDIANKIKQGK